MQRSQDVPIIKSAPRAAAVASVALRKDMIDESSAESVDRGCSRSMSYPRTVEAVITFSSFVHRRHFYRRSLDKNYVDTVECWRKEGTQRETPGMPETRARSVETSRRQDRG